MDLNSKLEKIKEKIAAIYPEEKDSIISALSSKQHRTFRVVETKDELEIISSLQNQGFKILNAEFEHIFQTDDLENQKISETPEYLEQKIYIQELSSQIPAIILEPKLNETILDLCAAPGSKTIQMVNISDKKAKITAIEKDRKRFFILKENLEKYGIKNVEIINADSTKLSEIKPEFLNHFDKVLVDAPCSSEGQLSLSNLNNLKYWNYKKWKSFVKIQKNLIEAGFKMLKPGGIMIYSTCTFSVEENEMVVDSLLKKFGDEVEIETIPENILKKLPAKFGFTEYKEKSFDKAVGKTIRILPTERFKGFYVAFARKK